MRSVLNNVVVFDFEKNGNMLETLNWDLNLAAFRHLKNLCQDANLRCPSFCQKLTSKTFFSN